MAETSRVDKASHVKQGVNGCSIKREIQKWIDSASSDDIMLGVRYDFLRIVDTYMHSSAIRRV